MIKSFNPQTIAITGANSYIGLNLIKFCMGKKINVRAFCRNPDALRLELANSAHLEIFPYNLDKRSELNFKKVDSIIHLAHERTYGARMNFNQDPNLMGATHLILQAKIHGIKNIVYLSSHLAHVTTLSQYGKSKFNCEKFFINNGHTALRAGMVFGGEAYGFYKSLLKTLKSKKVLPIICANAPIYPIHIEDLMNIMLMLSKFTHNTKKLYCLGEKHSIKLNFFLSRLAYKFYNKKIIFISLPGKIICLLTNALGYFNGFFNSIFERVAGALSLINLHTEESIDQNRNYKLIKTRIFFKS